MSYEEFSVRSPVGAQTYHCQFHTLTTGISPRHSDTVDVKFLVNGKGVVIALPHTAFVEHQRRTSLSLGDANAIQIAGCFLRELLEKGESIEDRPLVLTTDETLRLAERLRSPASK